MNNLLNQHLTRLSASLLKFHRELLFTQTQMVEKNDGRKYTPYELLHLSLTDPRFAWLKKFSELIIRIDIITDDKENKPFDGPALLADVRQLINPTASDGRNDDFNLIMKSDLSLMLSLGEVRTALSAAENFQKGQLS